MLLEGQRLWIRVPERFRGIGNSVHAETIASAAVAVRIFGAEDFQLCYRCCISEQEDLDSSLAVDASRFGSDFLDS